ncbi:MAG: methyltransferase domain-containing protein [Planctomycetota bacterium]
MFGRVQRFRPDLSRLQRAYAAILGNLSPSAEVFRVQLDHCLDRLTGRPARLLDAGCGKGTFSFYLSERYPEARILGVDLCPDLHALGSNLQVCEAIRERTGRANVSFRQLDLRELDAKGEYDLIVSIHVLEHIPDNEQVLERFVRALRPGGYLHIQMPSEDHHEDELECGELAEWAEEEHVGREYSARELCDLLEKAGLETVVCKTDGGWLAKWAWKQGEFRRFRGQKIRLALLWPLLKLLIRIGGRAQDDGQGNAVVLMRRPEAT